MKRLIFQLDGGPPRPFDCRWWSACLLASLLRHPWRAAAVLVIGAAAGWLTGYDVR
jgi:hypothetical protein